MYRANSSERLDGTANKENVRTPQSAGRKARSDSAITRKPTISSNVKIVLRLRGNLADGDTASMTVNSDANKDSIVCRGSQFEFSRILRPGTSQTEAYHAVVADAASQCLRGFNFSVLAYGQTGSGKTHSMSGSEAEPGIIPRFCDELFAEIQKKGVAESVYVTMSFYEIYNEKVYDLLGKERKPLRLRGGDDIEIVGLTTVGASSKEELTKWRKFGVSRRATAATMINELSSRSHAVFQLTIRRELSKNVAGIQDKKILVSHCFFVDLAGSEKLSRDCERQIETCHINKSLLALQRVVDARSSCVSFVNYRDSALTRILKPSFSGNSFSVILATVNPLEQYLNETLSTLRFASTASKIEQQPVQNEDQFTERVQFLVAENENIKSELQALYEKLATLNNAATVVTPQAPCIIELFEDVSLNLWETLCSSVQIIGFSNSVVAKVIPDGLNRFTIVAEANGVMLNGKELAVGEITPVKQNDGVVVNGQKCFTLYFNPDDDVQSLVTFTTVKLQYVTAQYEAEKEKIVKEALEDMRKEEADVKIQMENEMKEMRAELEAIRAREKLIGSSAETVKERQEAEKIMMDVQEMGNTLAAELVKTANQFAKTTMVTETDAKAQELLLQIKSRVALLNEIFEKTGKSKSFIFRVQQVNNSHIVRLFNRKFKLYADVSKADFDDLFNRFADIYQSSMTTDEIAKVIERFLYGDKLIWKNARGINAHSSNLFQMAVVNSLTETAKKRRSTVNDVRKSLVTRRSVLVDHIKDGNEPKNQWDGLQSYLAMYLMEAVNQPITYPESNIAAILDCCLEAKANFQIFSISDNFVNAVTSQKMASSIVGLTRSITSVKSLMMLSASFAIQNEYIEAGAEHYFKGMFEHAQIIRRAIDSWINACKESQPTKGQFDFISTELDYIVETCGNVAFAFANKFLPRHEILMPAFRRGINTAISEFTSENKNLLEGGLSMKRKVLQLLTKVIVEIQKTVDALEVYDENFTYDILRTAILIKERAKTTTDAQMFKIATKLEDLIDVCKCHKDNAPVEAISDYYHEFINLTKNSLLPPIPKRK